MMKNIIINTTIVAIGLTFASCSNMTIGFEEDSPLYNGPLIDTRKDKAIEPQSSKISKEVVAEEEIVTKTKREDETTFSYDPSDGD